MGSRATTVFCLYALYPIMRPNASIYRIRTPYVKGMSYAMETTKETSHCGVSKANRKPFYPGALWASKARGIEGLEL